MSAPTLPDDPTGTAGPTSAQSDSPLQVPDGLNEEAFFTTDAGERTLVTHADLEAQIPDEYKPHLREVERYWVNEPYSFVVIYHSERENEKRYYVIEPYLSQTERHLVDFLNDKLSLSLDYDNVPADAGPQTRSEIIRKEAVTLLKRYTLVPRDEPDDEESLSSRIKYSVESFLEQQMHKQATPDPDADSVDAVPRPTDDNGNVRYLTDRQVEKVLYYLVRDFIGFGKIDPIKHDINVEDISCDGYESNVFVYHSEYEQLITNIHHGTDNLDDYVKQLAQNAGKGISKRQPNVDATLADGSRAQLTLGTEVSDHGTNYTIRQFKDVPFTPVDLINWNTFSLDEMVYLWLCIENNKSMVIAGGTASGKTTALNAVSLFIPASSKIVSIEDTREVELPQRNWIASKTRESFQVDGAGNIDEFDLLEDALRQRPDYIVMGEVRGEEGRTLFQAMNTGHTTYTTFHADTVGEVIKRFTTDPIKVAKTMFGALDLVATQKAITVDGRTVRRNTSITEIAGYNPQSNEFMVDKAFEWLPSTDTFKQHGESDLLAEIQHENGWTSDQLNRELFKRKVVLSYLIRNSIKSYSDVAAVIQSFINDSDTTLGLIAQNELFDNLENLKDLHSINIEIDPRKEELVPRPDPDPELYEETGNILDEAEVGLFPDYAELDVQLTESLNEAFGPDPTPANRRQQADDGPAELNEDDIDRLLADVENELDDEAEPADVDDTAAVDVAVGGDDAAGDADADATADADETNEVSISELTPDDSEAGDDDADDTAVELNESESDESPDADDAVPAPVDDSDASDTDADADADGDEPLLPDDMLDGADEQIDLGGEIPTGDSDADADATAATDESASDTAAENARDTDGDDDADEDDSDQ